MMQPYLAVLRRVAVGGLLLVSVTGCYRWQLTSLEAQRRGGKPEKLRLELTNGEALILDQGVVTADSVVGAGASGIRSDRVAGLSARRLDRTMTGFLALGVLVPAVALVGVLTTNTCGAGAAPSC